MNKHFPNFQEISSLEVTGVVLLDLAVLHLLEGGHELIGERVGDGLFFKILTNDIFIPQPQLRRRERDEGDKGHERNGGGGRIICNQP
jgi:hypothetical protein